MSDLETRIVAIDIVLAAFALEAVGLLAYYALTKRGVAPAALMPNLMSGALLVLALRLWLSGAADASIAACLLGSFAAHIFDLRQRWRDPDRSSPAE